MRPLRCLDQGGTVELLNALCFFRCSSVPILEKTVLTQARLTFEILGMNTMLPRRHIIAMEYRGGELLSQALPRIRLLDGIILVWNTSFQNSIFCVPRTHFQSKHSQGSRSFCGQFSCRINLPSCQYCSVTVLTRKCKSDRFVSNPRKVNTFYNLFWAGFRPGASYSDSMKYMQDPASSCGQVAEHQAHSAHPSSATGMNDQWAYEYGSRYVCYAFIDAKFRRMILESDCSLVYQANWIQQPACYMDLTTSLVIVSVKLNGFLEAVSSCCVPVHKHTHAAFTDNANAVHWFLQQLRGAHSANTLHGQ